MGHVNPLFEQSGFRWRNDDGGEAAATWSAVLNASITLATATVARCRLILEETAGGAENNVSTQWQYRHNAGTWTDVTISSSVVQAATSTQGSLDAVATTQQISTGTFVSAEVTEDGLSDAVRPSFAGNEVTELELVFQLVDADVADTDTVELRVVRADGTLFDTYSQLATLTVDKAASPIVVQASPATLSAAAQAATPSLTALSVSAAPVTLTAAAQIVSPQIASSGSPVVESSTTTSISGVDPSFDMPATRPDGDLYVLVVGNDDFNDPDGMSEPTGWTRLHLTQNPAANTLGALVAWRIGNSEPASYTLPTDLSTFAGGAVVIRLSGIDTTTPIDVSGSDTADTGTSAVAPDVTTTVAQTLLLRLFQSDGASFSAVPATEEYNFEPTTASAPMAGSSEAGPDPAGSTGTSSATLASDDNWIAFTVAVAPPSSGGVTVQAAPATVSMAAQAASPQQTALTVSAVPATLVTSAQTVTPVLAPVAIQAAPALLTTAAQTTTPTLAALAVGASPVMLGVTAQVTNPVVSGAAVSVSAQPATLAVDAQATSPVLAALAVLAAPATLTASPQAASPTLAALAVQSSPVTLNVDAQTVNPIVAGAPVSISAAPATLTVTAQPADPVLTALVVQAVAAGLAVDAQPADVITAALAVQAAAASIGVDAQVVDPQTVTAGVTVSASPATLTVLAQAVDPTLVAFAIQASPATLTVAPQVVDPIRAGRVVAASPALIGVTAQAVSPTQAAIAIAAQPATILVSPQAVSLSVGAVADMVVIVGTPRLGWSSGNVGGRWSTGGPQRT